MTAPTRPIALDTESVINGFVVVIGAQRCGSTLLHRMLDRHPEISMVKPVRPEPKVFLDPDLTSAGFRTWVGNQLEGLDSSAKRFGEKSTSYIESSVAAANIEQLAPRARVIAIVRDPIDRAVSNYRFSVANGLETEPLEAALERELAGDVPGAFPQLSVSPFAYLGRGRYADHLSRYEERFGSERLLVLMFEEIIARPGSISNLYRWLGVDESFRPGDLGVVNRADGDRPNLSGRLRDRLDDYFRAGNLELAVRHDLDISRWN